MTTILSVAEVIRATTAGSTSFADGGMSKGLLLHAASHNAAAAPSQAGRRHHAPPAAHRFIGRSLFPSFVGYLRASTVADA